VPSPFASSEYVAAPAVPMSIKSSLVLLLLSVSLPSVVRTSLSRLLRLKAALLVVVGKS